MNRYGCLISLFCFAVPVIGAQDMKAEQAVQYYKAGDVGAFGANVEIPGGISIGTTIFTAGASDEKVYLLYVQSPRSVAERLTEGMGPFHRDHLSGIGKALLIYANDYDDKFPPSLEELVEEGYLSRETLESRRKPSGFEGPSYIYIAGQDVTAEPDNILVYENPAFCTDKINVLFMDCHVEAMRPTGFLEKLEATHKRLGREMPETWAEGREPAKPEPKVPAALYLKIFGRFHGSGKVKLTVFGRDSAELLAEPHAIASVELDLPGADGGDPELLGEWATAQAKEYVVRVLDSPHTSYYQYCLLQSVEKYGLSDSLLSGVLRDRGGLRGRGPDLYAMTTGALAIQESLQLEEMTGRREIPSERTVPISTLEGASVKSHPFEQMLQGRTPEIFPVAGLIPHDNYYYHFTSISKEIAAMDLFKQWGSSLLRAMSVTARDSDLPGRYMDQLCIDLSTLTRLFGDLVIGEIAMTGGDPFMKEGTDLAVIIQVKGRRVFEAMMNSYANGVSKANRDAKVSESEYEGVPIRSIVTPDRRISSHSAYLGDYKVYSNSMDTLQLIINTQAGKRKPMANNLDLQYMRTIFPGTAAAEDGFIYLSDSFIRKLLSPRWKIEAQRRIICQNHLRMIANAATMYRTEMRKKPSIKSLIEEEYLSDKAIRCPDGGTYSLDKSDRAFCAVHNCLQYCTPISSITLDQAAKVEARDYRQFVERYNRYWSRFFDPIGIRFRLGNRIEAETCILPLIENSIYNQLREIIGGDSVQLKSQVLTDRTIVSISSKLGIESEPLANIQREILEEIAPTLPPIRECVGDSLSINLYDSDVLFTFADEGMGVFGQWMDLEEQIIIGLIASSINLPIYGVIELKDEEMSKTLIREVVKVMQRRWAAEARRGPREFAVEPYSAGQYKGHEIGTLALRLLVVKFRLHYAIASGHLIVSTKRHVLEEVLDSLEKMQAGGGVKSAANVRVNVRPRAFEQLRPIMRLGWQERMRDACLKNLESVRALVECHGANERTLTTTSRRVEGVTLRCPCGGDYKYDAARGIVYCTIHGNCDHPRQPIQVVENEGLMDFIGRMTDLSVSLRFTEEGIMTKVAIELESKKGRAKNILRSTATADVN